MIFDIQKASLGKRISAYLFDVIIFAVLAVALAFGVSAITNFDAKYDDFMQHYDNYEEKYGISFDISAEEYDALSKEQKDLYDAAADEFSKDKDVIAAFSLIVSLTLVITSLGILFAYLILEFAIPLFFKNGQTLGKKIFGIALVRKDGVKVSPIALFVRTLLGKYTIETMIPVLMIIMLYFGSIGLLGIIIIAAVLITQIVFLIATRNNLAIHDALAATVVVDLSSQMIFETEEAMIEYKKNVHAEKATQQKYF